MILPAFLFILSTAYAAEPQCFMRGTRELDIGCVNQNFRDSANFARVEKADLDTAEVDIDAIQANYVTTNTTQTITAQKTMQSTIIFSSGTTYSGPDPSTPSINTIYPANIVKGYVVFIGTGASGPATILESFNVSASSVQKISGDGQYVIQWDQAFSNYTYPVFITPQRTGQPPRCNVSAKTTTNVTIQCYSTADTGAGENVETIMVMAVGKQ